MTIEQSTRPSPFDASPNPPLTALSSHTYDYDPAVQEQIKKGVEYYQQTHPKITVPPMIPIKREMGSGCSRLTIVSEPLHRNILSIFCTLTPFYYKLTDPAGRVTQWKLDTLSRITEKIMPDGVTKTTYTYQPRTGRLATMKRPNEQAGSSPTVTYSYHLDGRLQKEDYTATSTPDVTYTYEATAPGRVLSIVDGIGTTGISYGPFVTTPTSATANNIGQINVINGSMTDDDFTMTYDWQGRRVGSTLSGTIGRTETAVLDVLGRVKSIASPVAGTFDYTYSDLSSRPASLSYGSLLTTSFGYFPNSATGARAQRLQSITHTTPGQTPAIAASHVYDYDIAGRLTSWQKAGRGLTPVNESYGYNLSDELTRHETKNASTQATLDQRGWSYDLAGNWLSAGSPSNMTARTHNVMNRLTSTGGAGHTMVEGNVNEYADVKVNNQSVPLVADAANGGYRFRAKVPVTAGSNNVTIKATDPANEETNQTWQFTASATGKTYTYDANGNMLSDGTRTFTWDAKDRLKKIVVAGTVTEWDYDYLDRRVREYEYPSAATKILTKEYIWEGQQIAIERTIYGYAPKRTHYTHYFVDFIGGSSTRTLLPLKDHLGNVREVLGDGDIYLGPNPSFPGHYTGNSIVERWDYSQYQKPTKVSGASAAWREVNASLLVIGRYQNHASSGLQLALYRGYDPDLGRWISEDPLGEEGGLNLYGYVGNGPVIGVDLLGLAGFDADGSLNWSSAAGDACDVALDGLGTGIMQALDGINPFDDPFARGGWIPEGSDSNAGATIAGYTNPAGLGLRAAQGLGLANALAKSKALGLGSKLLGRGGKFGDKGIANANDVCRLGWSWKGSAKAGKNVLRMATGKPLKSGPQWLKNLWDGIRHMDILE